MAITREVKKNEVVALDFNSIAMKLGAKTAACNGRWCEFDEQDFRTLYCLLTKQIGDAGSAAESSASLDMLAHFCASAIQWFQRQKDLDSEAA